MGPKERISKVNSLIVGAVKNGQGELEPIEVRLKPENFSLAACYKIARDQINDVNLKRIVIHGLKGREVIYVSAIDLRNARLSSEYEKKEFREHLGYLIYNAEQVTIQRVSRYGSNKKPKTI